MTSGTKGYNELYVVSDDGNVKHGLAATEISPGAPFHHERNEAVQNIILRFRLNGCPTSEPKFQHYGPEE